MNNYQIYDEVGKGRHSVVYKGRKKKSIEYFAIASIEKGQRQRVLTSVQFLRSLNHRNVLKFHNWYETNNHLWVITEYCVGGNLRAVLDLDQRLSETSVRVFGCDLLEGLMHIHSRGIVYGDLKPSNILMDATASLRYYDFGLSCSFDNAANASKVGTPSYMAPELFRDGGIPSVASDLWSLGCVLYEMAAGRPPFSANSIQGLIQKIVNEPYRRLENSSAALQELLEALLQKDPLERASWADVVNNEFWQGRVSPVPPLPAQPAFETFKQQHRPLSKEVEKRNKDIMRASINAERNLARELGQHQSGGGAYAQQGGGAPSTAAQGVLHIDREVDFTEHTTEGGLKPLTPPTTMDGDNSSFAMTHSKMQPASSAPIATGDHAAFTPMESLIIHPSDAHIRPLVTNARIEKYVEQRFEPATLGFTSMTLSALKQLPNKDLELFLTSVYKALSTPSQSAEQSEKLNVLAYFETLCGDSAIANVVINSSVMTLCVRLIGSSKGAGAFRCAVASIMGLLVRHATFIHCDLAKSGIIDVLVAALAEETNTRTIRKLLACVGELLFYVGTQSSEERVSWPIPTAQLRSVFLSALSHEDDITKHYAVKAIENLASINDRTVAREVFGSVEVVNKLFDIYALPLLPPARTEHLKSSAVCAALKLCFVNDHLIVTVLFARAFPCQAFGEAFATCNAKIVQILITVVNYVLWRTLAVQGAGHHASEVLYRHGAHAEAGALSPEASSQIVGGILGNSKAFLDGLCSVLEHNAGAVRGKGLLCVSLLCTVGGGFALGEDESRQRVFQIVDKLIKDKDTYVQSCSSMAIRSMCRFTESVVHVLAGAQHTIAPSVFVAALHTVTSPNIRPHLAISADFLVHLSTCVRGCNDPNTSAYYSPHEQALNHMVEAIAADPTVRQHHYMVLASTVVEPFGELLTHAEGSKRFSAIQVILHLLAPIVQDASLYNPAASICPVVPLVNQFVTSLIPRVPHLLRDNEPIPLYTMKLLSMCCDRSPTLTLQLNDSTTLKLLLSFLDPSHPSNSVYVVRLLLRILQCSGDDVMRLAVEDSLIQRLLLTMTMSKQEGALDTFAEPCFELVFVILCAAVNEPQSQVAQLSSHFIVEQRLESLFFFTCTSSLGAAAECAASSVYLLTQLFSEARQAILQPACLGACRELFSSVEESSLHTVLPLLRSLLLCVAASSSKAEVRPLQQNEPLLVVLHTLSESTLSTDLASVASEILQALYKVS
ncbi:protein kinase, putative [Bodo saltans]|uniref:Protein kinase, putative n=1 Tax=Bodo saltans TaxID=75058 RepID=A0A0S4J7J9_BODSA|nr:protein kinase, putative [Bodo saltans]|eukprot:CUG87382.1 protein kinase, putative [Bodo saltans]